MKLKEILVIGILFLIGFGFTYFYQNYFIDERDKVCFEGDCFYVEVVDNNGNRMKGLMFREFLGDDEGMLFVLESSGIYPFWMKNTLITLDMIWINSEKEVVFIQENAAPCEEDPCRSYNPGVEALYVLEINGGKSLDIGLEVGDKLDFYIE